MRPVRSPMLLPRLSVVAWSSSIALVISTGSSWFSCSHSCSNCWRVRKITGMRWFSISSFRKFRKVSSAPSSIRVERVLLLRRGEVGREEEHGQLAVGVQRVGELAELLAQLVELALLARDLEQRAGVYLGELLHQLFDAPEEIEREVELARAPPRTSRFWSAESSVLRVTFSVASTVRSATSLRMSSSARCVAASMSRSARLAASVEDLLAALFGLVLVRLRRLARALDDLFGLRARLLQALAVFGSSSSASLRVRSAVSIESSIDLCRRPSASEMRGNASFASRTIVNPNTSSVQTIRPMPGLIRKLPFEASTAASR